MACGGVGQSQGAHNRQRLAAAVANHTDAINAEEQCSTVFGVVESLFDPFEVAAQKG